MIECNDHCNVDALLLIDWLASAQHGHVTPGPTPIGWAAEHTLAKALAVQR